MPFLSAQTSVLKWGSTCLHKPALCVVPLHVCANKRYVNKRCEWSVLLCDWVSARLKSVKLRGTCKMKAAQSCFANGPFRTQYTSYVFCRLNLS